MPSKGSQGDSHRQTSIDKYVNRPTAVCIKTLLLPDIKWNSHPDVKFYLQVHDSVQVRVIDDSAALLALLEIAREGPVESLIVDDQDTGDAVSLLLVTRTVVFDDFIAVAAE